MGSRLGASGETRSTKRRRALVVKRVLWGMERVEWVCIIVYPAQGGYAVRRCVVCVVAFRVGRRRL